MFGLRRWRERRCSERSEVDMQCIRAPELVATNAAWFEWIQSDVGMSLQETTQCGPGLCSCECGAQTEVSSEAERQVTFWGGFA